MPPQPSSLPTHSPPVRLNEGIPTGSEVGPVASQEPARTIACHPTTSPQLIATATAPCHRPSLPVQPPVTTTMPFHHARLFHSPNCRDSAGHRVDLSPSLQYFELNGIPFPGLPNLFLSANCLVFVRVFLWFSNIPHSGHISPEAIAALTRPTSKNRFPFS
jgi:hypothetical protein